MFLFGTGNFEKNCVAFRTLSVWNLVFDLGQEGCIFDNFSFCNHVLLHTLEKIQENLSKVCVKKRPPLFLNILPLSVDVVLELF